MSSETRLCTACAGKGYHVQDAKSPVHDSNGRLIEPGIKMKAKCPICRGTGRVPK